MGKAGQAGRVWKIARDARAELERHSRPAGEFDASRYFRAADHLGFYNVGSQTVRRLAREIVGRHPEWTVRDAVAFAEALMPDRHLEVKGLGIEALARFRRQFTPALLPVWKRWLAADYASNWATTDAMCGLLIGPLLVAHPALVEVMPAWSRHRNLWVRRASVVGLIKPANTGAGLDVLYENAARLHADPHDLIHKGVGWALREAGKADAERLERYLRRNGGRIPRTTLRYAIERFAPARRRELLDQTKAGRALRRRSGRAVEVKRKR